ncbi:1,4-alpha-glucan branching protein GlgB [Sinimarinibacterium sp. CAU 1509]|nr:1,4-alpha-glucan branching protein GlgB [Sinimarinibacterium sp. CAU 1509]TJY60950.1 1,4-alpha-glucan branching protein GlgB [Sinimarinibacterium sp. CAU 1509]
MTRKTTMNDAVARSSGDRAAAAALNAARHPDPFGYLGRHADQDAGDAPTQVVRAYLPSAKTVRIAPAGIPLKRVRGTDLFIGSAPGEQIPQHYRLIWTDSDDREHHLLDPYSFGSAISEFDRQVFAEGGHWHAYRFLGAHHRNHEGHDGVVFSTWAPGAQRVSVVGDFNHWDGRRHPMRRHPGGIWDLFIPELPPGTLYKFELCHADGSIGLKADPYAQQSELRPKTASVVTPPTTHQWRDQDWMHRRGEHDWLHAPMSIYEVHLGSWQRDTDGHWLDYASLAQRLLPHVRDAGFTHIELLPVMEHPFDGSWGYQTLGYFAPTARFGDPDGFRAFVDTFHQAGIGVLLDWTPAHFPSDPHGLASFDGTALYEHADPRRGYHPDWNTLIYDYGRPEVRNFLLASALYWLDEFHCDGLRVDAVASMLYLDYSREPGQWLPNAHGGRENLDAIAFLQQLNAVAHEQHPGAVIIAEESTAWPMVTKPTWVGGLGFSMKWNMGWMHDSLDYLEIDPVYRQYRHDRLTFGLLYAHSENFVLPLSHDEVVHGKRSLLEKMHGDDWRKFAQLRLLYAYQWTYPGKKLLFMGQEFAQRREWDHDRALDWSLLDQPPHRGVLNLVSDLNRAYRELPALHHSEFDGSGFEWIDCHDNAQSVLSYLRRDGNRFVIVILNFTPVPRHGYRIGVPTSGAYRERLNTDAACYGGSNIGNLGTVHAEAKPWMQRSHSLELTLPPLAALILEPVT